jgi:hypothetical protein
MSAATPPRPGVLRRWRDPRTGQFFMPPGAPLNHIHTIRVPDPTWSVAKTLAKAERRQEGASEILREALLLRLHAELRAAGVPIGDDEEITEAHADAYSAICSARRP